MIRTLTFALRRDPDTSRHIGYYATQQNLAYNHAVDVLNREPHLPKRSGQNHPDALNKRITVWRRPTGKKPTHPTTSTRKAANRLGKPISDYRKLVRHDSNASPKPRPVAKHPSTATSAHIAAPWLIATANNAASASPSPTGGSSKSATTERPSPADSALSPSRFEPTGTSNSWTSAPYDSSP